MYYRQGVIRDKNSFIHCVLKAKNINRSIKKIKKELIKPNYIACCKQEMYDYTIEDIREKIKNNDEYFDPKLFIHLLEIKYNCNIFIFTRDNNGEMILPRCANGYYKLKNKNKCKYTLRYKNNIQ